MLSKQTKEVAENIGEFYLARNNNDYCKTEEDLEKLGITEIIAVGDAHVVIKLKRIGLLIGRRGENILALEKALGKKFHLIENEFSELEGHLIPRSLESLE